MMLMPLMMPPVITALMWKVMMASTEGGVLNYLLGFLGLGPVNWFGSPVAAMASILIIDTWGNLPFVALILLGGLQALPTEPYEAARVDGAGSMDIFRRITLPLLGSFLLLAVTFRTMDSLRTFDVIYATTVGGPADATTNLHIMAYTYAFQWYQMGKGTALGHGAARARGGSHPHPAQAGQACGRTGGAMSASVVAAQPRRRTPVQPLAWIGLAVLLVWTLFPFLWVLMTSLKTPTDIISVPPKFTFVPTIDNYQALLFGEAHGDRASTRPDFPLFFVNSLITSSGAMLLSLAAGIPAAYALARYNFRMKNALAFLLLSFRFAPFLTFLIPLYLIYQRLGLYNTHIGLILAYQLITLPFTVWMLRSFFAEVPNEVVEAAEIDGCSWWVVLTRLILPLTMPGVAVTIILGFMFSWNTFSLPLMLAGRETFPVTVGAIQFISYEQVLWGQMSAATIIAVLPQLVLSLFVQKYIVRGLTMGAAR